MANDLFEQYTEEEKRIIDNITKSQLSAIEKASKIAADSISKGHVMFMFGSGHSIMPIVEIYPRYGGVLGFMPIIDLGLSFFTPIIGNLGFSQFNYLENSSQYADSIIENYKIHKEDSLLLVSHSGSTQVTVEMGLKFKEIGEKIVSFTSIHRCLSTPSKHPSGKTLMDISDVIVDTGVPDADVVMNISGAGLGPMSSIGTLTIANLLSIGTFNELIKRGLKPLINPVRAFDPDADKKMKEVIDKYRELFASHIH